MHIVDAQETARESIHNTPQVDGYIKIDINSDYAVTTLFVYIENESYYIVQPYPGIYKIDSKFYEK